MVNREIDQQYGIDIVAALAKETINRLWIVIIILVLCIAGLIGWIIYRETQFQAVEETTNEIEQEVDTGEGSAIVSGVGDIYYGEDQAESQNDEN